MICMKVDYPTPRLNCILSKCFKLNNIINVGGQTLLFFYFQNCSQTIAGQDKDLHVPQPFFSYQSSAIGLKKYFSRLQLFPLVCVRKALIFFWKEEVSNPFFRIFMIIKTSGQKIFHVCINFNFTCTTNHVCIISHIVQWVKDLEIWLARKEFLS